MLMYDDAGKQGLKIQINENDGGRKAMVVVTTNANQPESQPKSRRLKNEIILYPNNTERYF